MSSISYGAALESFFEEISSKYTLRDLQKAFQVMHMGYISQNHRDMALKSQDQAIAYVSSRRIATLQSIQRVLKRLKEHMPHFTPKTLLDIGSGPLTALQAFCEFFNDSLTSAELIESNPFFCEIIEQALAILSKKEFRLIRRDMTDTTIYQSLQDQGYHYDIAIMSYSLGEIAIDQIDSLIASLMLISDVILLIEPGTPRGSNRLMRVRNEIIQSDKWALIAPCLHSKKCPFLQSQQWCHETVRLSRTALVQEIKSGSFGFEDESMSYLIAAKKELKVVSCESQARIIHRPQHRSGHSHFQVCASDGEFHTITLSKRDGAHYKEMKKRDWGDLISYKTKSP